MHGLGDTVVASRDPSRLSTLLETREVARHDAQPVNYFKNRARSRLVVKTMPIAIITR